MSYRSVMNRIDGFFQSKYNLRVVAAALLIGGLTGYLISPREISTPQENALKRTEEAFYDSQSGGDYPHQIFLRRGTGEEELMISKEGKKFRNIEDVTKEETKGLLRDIKTKMISAQSD